MEAQEEVTTQNIVKGKRTKRQRVQSPIPFALTTNSSSDDGGDGSGGGGGDDCTNGIVKVWSPTSSNELLFPDNATEEEEDMANCLILLAQGNSRDQGSPKHHLHKDNIEVAFYNNYNNNSNNVKFNSRRFLETGSPGSGKAGYYVYECKTCSRTFPSFQALGGHRASHKKPKAMNNNVNVDEQKTQLVLSSDEEDGHYKNISSLSLQLSNSNTNRSLYHNTNQNSNNKSKIHECSICGAEFTSGQALGGHMRRHRGPIGGGSSSALSLTPLAIESEEPQKARNLLSLDLDLNLPAPDEEDKLIHFASKQQQQQQEKKSPPIVFSSPALVDCHY